MYVFCLTQARGFSRIACSRPCTGERAQQFVASAIEFASLPQRLCADCNNGQWHSFKYTMLLFAAVQLFSVGVSAPILRPFVCSLHDLRHQRRRRLVEQLLHPLHRALVVHIQPQFLLRSDVTQGSPQKTEYSATDIKPLSLAFNRTQIRLSGTSLSAAFFHQSHSIL